MALSTTASLSSSASPQHDEHDDTFTTPSRKVKALLAQFDDSDSDRSIPGKNVKTAFHNLKKSVLNRSNARLHTESPGASRSEDQASDDEELQREPRGRLAARMQAAAADDHSEPSEEDSGAKAYARIQDRIAQISKSKATALEATSSGRSGDELQSAAPRRRLLQRKSVAAGDRISRQGTRSPSPLFFPSPSATKFPGNAPSGHNSQHDSDSEEIPEDPLKQSGSKFLALVEKHRKQRVAREAAGEAKRAERLEQLKRTGSRGSPNVGTATFNGPSDDSDVSDADVGKRLTQQARPTRKATKKALEEMNRETQRMSRSMQLAHQARTKKKITKESLLARFNFITPASGVSQRAETGHASQTASSAPGSDREEAKEQITPPTSPLAFEKDKQLAPEAPTSAEPLGALVDTKDREFPAMGDLLTSQLTALDKGKSNATPVDEPTQAATQPIKTTNKPRARPIQVRWSKQDAIIARGADSDSDLEIVTSKSKSKKFAAFETLPQRRSRETNSHLILRSLAHIRTSIPNDKHTYKNAAQMEAQLRRAARIQVQREREEKLEELKSRGIFCQTAEERQKEQQEVEDLVDKARVEGAEIHRREKEKAKKDRTFVKDELDDDESDDEDDADFEDENEDIYGHVSGSEEEIDEDRGDDPEGGIERVGDSANSEEAGMIDQEADEAESEEGSEDGQSGDEDDDKPEDIPLSRSPGRSRRKLVLSDEEDDEEDVAQHASSPQNAKTPQSVLRSARKIIPGLQMSDDLPIGLTQAFAATMADSGSEDEGTATQEQDSLTLTRDLPSPHFNAIPSLNRFESLDIIADSQPATQMQPFDLDLSIMRTQTCPQSPADMSSTQFSFMPTQDVGYVMSPFEESRFDTPLHAPHSTIDTIILPQDEQSPILQRKGRLRRGRATVNSHDEAEDGQGSLTGFGLDKSAFAVMQRAAKRVDQQTAFEKSKLHSKELVEEAAEESEDEYAGLGGASDDDEGEEDEADKRIIDHDETLGQGDEGRLAGFHADKERKQDEAVVSKLFKDITTGALRRKRGAANDLDLSDEEDANVRRREAKRREFARMRRELLKDEAVGKIAEDKKKQAFLKSIEDRDEVEDEDMAFHEEENMENDTKSQPQPAGETTILTKTPTPESRAHPKRPLEPSAADITNRPPPALRRTGHKAGPVHRKPSTLAQIREHVLFLVEEPDSQSGTPDPNSSDDEAVEPVAYVDLDRHLHNADEENEYPDEGLADFIVDDERPAFKKPQLPTTRAPPTERRTKPNVVDRLTLLRQASSSSSGSSSTHHTGGSKLAFFSFKSTSSENTSSFQRVPNLIRRATTNSSLNSEAGATMSATGVTERGAVEQEKEMVRKAQGGRRSAINYYAKGRLEEREKVREGRVGKSVATKAAKKVNGGFLGGLFGRDSWG